MSPPQAPSASLRDTKWADGLRGIASLLVVTAHIARSLGPLLLSPALSDTLPPTFLQLPFIRCLFMGRASVAIFAVLSGYVNALKPTKQARAGQIDAALAGVAKSAFRRTGRFMIPAMVSTVLSWFVCQFGAYKLAKVVDSQWIRDTSPIPSNSFVSAFVDLSSALIHTWTDGGNPYDMIQWTLCYLLKGSMFVYLSISATIYMQPKWRIMAYAAMYMYYWRLGDAVIGINIYCGLILAEITYEAKVQDFVDRTQYSTACISSFLMIFGWFINSYPEDHPEWSTWSSAMNNIGQYLFPGGSEYGRFYPGIGANLICVGILFNGTAKRMLSHPFLCWLGKMSFAIYLIHAPILRIFLTWMVYGFSTRLPSQGVDENGNPLPPPWIAAIGTWWWALIIPFWYVMLYRMANVWVAHVEPWCGRATNWVENLMFEPDLKAEKPLLS